MDVQIDPDAEYSPRQITNNGWIKNTMGKTDYFFVLKLINRDFLKARNLNPEGKLPVFMVKGQAILDYLNN